MIKILYVLTIVFVNSHGDAFTEVESYLGYEDCVHAGRWYMRTFSNAEGFRCDFGTELEVLPK